MLCKNRMRAIIAYYGIESQASAEWVRDAHPERRITIYTSHYEKVATQVRDETVQNILKVIAANPRTSGEQLTFAIKQAMRDVDLPGRPQ